jgi:hypothetical protein
MQKILGNVAAGRAAPIVLGLVVMLLVAITASAAFAQNGTVYRFCKLAKSPYGNPVYYSAVFEVDYDISANGVENDFNAFVSAQYDPDAISGSICFGPYDSYRDADNYQNELIAKDRRDGDDVVLTRWYY